jgi:hypothetical protein
MLVVMDSESAAILSEAYQRLHRNGPEFGGDQRGDNGLTNHGPMAVEVICRRGLEIDVHRWLDRYIRRLTGLPATAEPITDATWRQALGGGHRRIGDWTAYFSRELDRLARLPGWPAALGALRPPATAAGVPARLAELVDAATTLYLTYGAASPVLLVHTATAPNAALAAAEHAARLIDPP